LCLVKHARCSIFSSSRCALEAKKSNSYHIGGKGTGSKTPALAEMSEYRKNGRFHLVQKSMEETVINRGVWMSLVSIFIIDV
jgi:hypothetical protein